MKNLVNSLSKYTGITAEQITLAMEAIEDDIAEDIEAMVEEYTQYLAVEHDEDEQGRYTYVDAEDFKEKFVHALMSEYKVEPR